MEVGILGADEGGGGPEGQDKRAKRDGVFVDQSLAERKAGVGGPRNGKAAEPSHHVGAGEFVGEPGPPRQTRTNMVSPPGKRADLTLCCYAMQELGHLQRRAESIIGQ